MHQCGSHWTDFPKIWSFQENLITKSNKNKLDNISDTLSSMVTLLTSVRNVYFAARQQGKGSPFLRFHGNTQQLYTADSYTYFNTNTKGKYICVSIATMIVMFYVLCLSCCVQYLWQNSCFECWTYSTGTAITLTWCSEKCLTIRLRDLSGKWGRLAGIVPSIRTGWTTGTTWCLQYSGSNFGHLK